MGSSIALQTAVQMFGTDSIRRMPTTPTYWMLTLVKSGMVANGHADAALLDAFISARQRSGGEIVLAPLTGLKPHNSAVRVNCTSSGTARWSRGKTDRPWAHTVIEKPMSAVVFRAPPVGFEMRLEPTTADRAFR